MTREAKADTVVAAAAGIVRRFDGYRKKLRRALKPLADVPLERDANPTAPDHIAAADLSITPAQVRAARKAMAETA